MSESQVRDIVEARPVHGDAPPVGRRVIAVIGIDRYAQWPRLYNAVSDARKVEQTFVDHGFTALAPSLFDAAATHTAIDDLLDTLGHQLTPDDHLVVFFAGHGSSVTHYAGSEPVTTGYLIPVDGTLVHDRPASLFEIDSLLHRISRLAARHILVILDACHSGKALASAMNRARGEGGASAPFARIHAKNSRVVIASTLSDETAQDSGPLPNHSVFTACLVHALEHDMPRIDLGDGQLGVHGSSLGAFVRERIHLNQREGHRQTPDFGRFGNDDRGDMPIVLARATDDQTTVDHVAVDLFARGSAPVIRSKIDPELAHAFEPAFTSQFEIPRFESPPPRTRRARWWAIRWCGIAALAIAAAGALAWARPSPPVATVAEVDDRAPATAEVADRAVQANDPPPPAPPPRPLSVIRTVAARCYARVNSIPHGADVFRNRVKIGAAPTRVELPCGVETALTFQMDDHISTTKTVIATPEGTYVSTRLKRTPAQ